MPTPSSSDAANAAERRRWNDEAWVARWLRREQLTAPVAPILQNALDLQSGERVVDIGSGGGLAAAEYGRAVGPAGDVLGVDLSNALVDLARERAERAGLSNVSFMVADAQTEELPGRPFDVATSKLGVMFFDDPAGAFANIRAHLRPGGRLGFACFQSSQRNPWHTGALIAEFAPPAPPPAAGSATPGPFSLGDAAATDAVLRQAGFADIGRRDLELTVRGSSRAVYEPDQLAAAGVAPELVPTADAAIVAHFAQFEVGPDAYDFPLAISICTATNPEHR